MNNSQRAELLQLVGSSGYEVFQQMVAEERNELLRELETSDPANTASVLAAQAVLHGFSIGISNIQNRIALEIEIYKAELGRKEPNPQQLEVNQILSPFGLEE